MAASRSARVSTAARARPAAPRAAAARAPSRAARRRPRRPPAATASTQRPARAPGPRGSASASDVRGAERSSGVPSGTSSARRSRPPRRDRAACRWRRSRPRCPGVRKPARLRRHVDAGVGEGVALEIEGARLRERRDLLPGEERAVARLPAEHRRARPGPPRRRPRWAAGPGPRGIRPGTRNTTPACRAGAAAARPRWHRLPRPSSKVSSTARSGRRAAPDQDVEVLVGARACT